MATHDRVEAIDRLVEKYEPALSHDEAVYIVRRFEI